MNQMDMTDGKAATFGQFEASLSESQRQFLLKHPDLLNPELIGQLYQTSLERVSMSRHLEVRDPISFAGNGEGEVRQKKPRKVVNSWMAFRSYYSPLIKDIPQKVRSPMLALLWKHDVDHGLWELLSAAFSYIRDNHSEDGVTIDQFLSIATQIIPVIPADQYFARAGWIRIGDVLNQVAVSPKELSKTTNVSSAGIARFCFRQGLISKPPTTKQADLRPSKKLPSSISFAAMASVPLAVLATNQPNPVTTEQPISAEEDIELCSVQGADGSGTPGIVPITVDHPNEDHATPLFGSMTDDLGVGAFVMEDFWKLTD